MTKHEANALLDYARAGGDVSDRSITEALSVTGDLGRAATGAKPSPVEASREWPYYAVTETA